jgi:CRISPR-associated endonuclease/helicase Cas3
MSEVWAHSVNHWGKRHLLADHLRGTALLARDFGGSFGAGDLAAYLGLIHDIGKVGKSWQERLLAVEGTSEPVGIDHKSAGTWHAARIAGPFATCVYGHHGGLPAGPALKNLLRDAASTKGKEWDDAAAAVVGLLPEIAAIASGALVPSWAEAKGTTAQDMLTRMLFSSLADADFLDTESHFHGASRPAVSMDLNVLADRFEERRAELVRVRATGLVVDGWRQEVYDQAVRAAAGPCGVYRFGSPTGSGKTIAAGGFGLHHARARGLERVIVAVPFISITEQNADVYRGLLDAPGERVVLEHHSSAVLDSGEPGGWWQRLAAENWEAPFIVTTTAQLFQSLFSNRPAAMRKVHRLAKSVIILDEVQAIPDRLLVPVLSALRMLTERFGATVLLASATQPSYWDLKPFRDVHVCDIIGDRERLYSRFRRVRYEWRMRPRPTLAQIAAEAAAERQVLIVVNTTADSATVHRDLEQRRDGACLHLSTRMAAQHRRDVLAKVNDLLAADKPVAVVSTQLIEAGVDVDFPVVYRAWAPADSLQQAAGRANRNGRLAEGRVVVFDPSDGHHPNDSSYKTALQVSESYFGPGLHCPDDPQALDRYYQDRYKLQSLEDTGLGHQIERLRQDLDFPEVAAKFQLIDERTVPVVVHYRPVDDEMAEGRLAHILARLRRGGIRAPGETRMLFRELQPFLASIPSYLAPKVVQVGDAEPVLGDLLEWRGEYHRQRGIDLTSLAGIGRDGDVPSPADTACR